MSLARRTGKDRRQSEEDDRRRTTACPQKPSRRRGNSSPVDLAAVADANDDDHEMPILNVVDDPIVANTDSIPAFRPGEFDG